MTSAAHPKSPASFVELLQEACTRQVNMDVFSEGYAQVMKVVAEPADVVVHGLRLHSPAGVYTPHETSSTRFFMDHFFALGLDKPKGRLLEIGCGAGGIALLAARNGWEVTACDIDPVAVEATLKNAWANGLTVRTLQSDLLCALPTSEKFDAILFNQPFWHPEREISEDERTLTDPGGRLYVRFMEEAKSHLAPGGFVAVAYANFSNTRILHQPGWQVELRAFDYEAGADGIRALFRARRAAE